MLRFRTYELPGYHTPLAAGPPELSSRVTHFPGLHGVSEIVSGQTHREVSAMIWLSRRDWRHVQARELFAKLADLDSWVGQNGDVVESQDADGFGLPRRFRDCTFLGFTPLAVPGQQAPGPLQDLALQLHDYGSQTAPAWFQYGRLAWVQILPGSEAA